MKRVRCFFAGIAAAAIIGCGYGTPPRPSNHSLQFLNNTGAEVSNFGLSYGRGPVDIGKGLVDRGWVGVNFCGGPPPDAVSVFWEAPPGVRHEIPVDVRSAVPATTEYVNVYFVLRADGDVDVVVLTDAQAEADDRRALHEMWALGRPADKPYIRQWPR